MQTVTRGFITKWAVTALRGTKNCPAVGMKTALIVFYHFLRTEDMAEKEAKKKSTTLVSSDRYMKQQKTDAYAELIVAALKAAELYKPEKEPAIYMLATLLELYQKTRADIEKNGLTVEASTKTSIQTRANPSVAMNLSYANAIQKYLQQLGLSAAMVRASDDDHGNREERENSPLEALRRTIEENRAPVILKIKQG